MKSAKRNDGLWMGFNILTNNGKVPKPQHIQFWEPHQYKDKEPEAPFHYAADALLGLSLIHLNQNLQNPFLSPKMNYSFACESWKALEPHHELYTRAQPRISALRSQIKPKSSPAISAFERQFTEILGKCKTQSGFDLTHFGDLIDAIETLEADLERPLLYNMGLQFSREVVAQMHYLHSALFNLRALIAMDHNAQTVDPVHEAAKVDSITDYLPKAEYVANDALLYWSFKKVKEQIPAEPSAKMEHAFFTYSHNGALLIESLPKDFLNKMSWEELEESLYLVQMDWLLGTESGLLFRLREEVYGLTEGYDKIFYPDLTWSKSNRGGSLSVNVQLTENSLYPKSEAA